MIKDKIHFVFDMLFHLINNPLTMMILFFLILSSKISSFNYDFLSEDFLLDNQNETFENPVIDQDNINFFSEKYPLTTELKNKLAKIKDCYTKQKNCFDIVVPANIDDCDYASEIRYGDMCTPYGWDCHCGNQTINIERNWKHCCLPPSSSNETHCYFKGKNYTVVSSVLARYAVHCEEGEALPILEPCNGKCYNEYQDKDTTSLGWKSQYKCASGNECVPVLWMCQGYALCNNKSDIEACQDLECLHSGDENTLWTDVVRGHKYCSYSRDYNDGEYNAIGREDETDLRLLSKHVSINYELLEECVGFEGNQPGIICNNACRINGLWCRSDYISSCSNGDSEINTNNRKLCSNTSFWSNKSCNTFDKYNEVVLGYGLRCSGQNQHCYNPWYQTINSIYEETTNKPMLYPSLVHPSILLLKFTSYVNCKSILFLYACFHLIILF